MISPDNKFDSEESLNDLLNEVYSECKKDLEEAEENIDLYKEKIINTETGLEQYGQLHNDSLRIKGLIRDRQLNVIKMVKDKITTAIKNNSLDKGDGTNVEEMMAAAESAASLLREEMKEERRKGVQDNNE